MSRFKVITLDVRDYPSFMDCVKHVSKLYEEGYKIKMGGLTLYKEDYEANGWDTL
jgi:hypothetical protein